MKSILTCSLVLTLLSAAMLLKAQTLDRNVFTTNGSVYTTAQSGDTVYVGGNFSQMGYGAKKFTRFANGSTKPDFNFPQLDQNSTLYAVEPDGNGGFYLGGYIYSYNGTKFYPDGNGFAGVIHILSDYSLDPAFTPTDMNGTPNCLKKKGDRLYVGGNFSYINGTNINYLAALDATTGVLTNWTPEAPNSSVDQIEATDALVYIHGNFSYIGNRYITSAFAALKATDGTYTKYLTTAGNAISAFKVNNDKLYLGGTFQQLGYTAQGITKVSSTTAAQDLTFPETDGSVYALLADGSGGYYVGGTFSQIAGVNKYYLAHLLADGTVDPSFNVEVNGQVHCLATDGTNLYFGGYFTNVNSNTRNYAAAVNRTTGALTTWNPNADNAVWTMVYAGNTIYMGGGFTNVKGTNRNYAAAVTTANTLTSWSPNPDSHVYQMIANNNGTSIFICGPFGTVKGATHNYVAKVNTTNGNPASWNPSPNNIVNSLALNGSKLYLGGYFGAINGIAKQYFAEIDTTSNNPTAFQADANNAIVTLNIISGKLYVGGYFTQLKATNISYAARIDLTTKTVDSWNPGLNNYPRAFAGNGSSIVLGGDFNLANGAARSYLAAIDLTTNQLTSFSANVTSWSVGSINQIYFYNNELFAGGNFNYYNPEYSNYYYSIIALDTSSGNITRYFDYTPNTVSAIAVSNNKLFLGGSISYLYDPSQTNVIYKNNLISYNLSNNSLNSDAYEPNSTVRSLQPDATGGIIAAGDFTLTSFVNRQYLGAINLKTGQATNWSPNVNGFINSMAVKDTSLFISGTFNSVYNSDYTIQSFRAYLGAISTKTGLATNWNADLDNYPENIAIKDTLLYVGGSFTTIKGIARNYAAAVGTGGTGTVKAWAPNPNSTVRAIQPIGNNVYIGGNFTTVKGATKNYLASVNNSNGNLNAWNPNPDNVVYTLTANGTTLYAGGAFSTISSQSRQSVAAFTIATNALTSFNPKLSNTYLSYPYINALAQYSKALFIGSDGNYYQAMDSIKGVARHLLGAADTITGSATAFDPNPNQTIRTVKAGSSKLFVGGDYTSLGLSPSSSYFNVFSLEPLTQASALSFNSLQPTSVTANWTKGSGEGSIVIVKQGSAAGVPADGNGYNANAVFGQGSSISGGYVVYKNTGNSINVTNLLPNHTYYFAVYEYNGTGTGTEYLQTPSLTGNITTPCVTYTNIVSPAGPLSFCQGDSTVLTAIAGMSSYNWNTGATTRSITVKTSGSYTIQVADSNACGATSQPVVVTVNASPIPTTTPSGNVTIASGSSTNITVNESYPAYLWSTGATTQSINVNTAGNYTATVTDNNGCKGTTAPVVVSISGGCPKPTITVSAPVTDVCPGKKVTLTATKGTSYLWSTGATTQKITVSAAGSYYVTVTKACGSATSDPTVVTYQSCGNPTALVVNNITANAAHFSWAAVTCGTKYNLQYKKSGTTTWTTVMVKGTDTTITGLLAATTYNWRVQTVCTTPKSGFTNGTNFKTAVSLLADVTGRNMKGNGAFKATVYPNPASTTAVLNITGSYKPVTVILSDLTGKVLLKYSNITSTQIYLPVTNLSAAVYIITVTNGEETRILKLIKGQQ